VDRETASRHSLDPAFTQLSFDPDSNTVLLRDGAARAFASLPAVHYVDEAGLTRAISDPNRDPAHHVWVLGAGQTDLPAPTGTITATRPQPDTIEATAVTSSPGLAVFTENCSSGWSATIDGEPAALVKADGVQCAVPVPTGSHQLRLHYLPPGWPWVWIPFGFALAGIAWSSVSRIRRRGALDGPAQSLL
jgi:hypothetical protein